MAGTPESPRVAAVRLEEVVEDLSWIEEVLVEEDVDEEEQFLEDDEEFPPAPRAPSGKGKKEKSKH